MGVDVDDSEDLRGQVEDLRSRLEEAEETLRAIRRGEVDALVVHEPGGDRVYTFQGADQSYRLLIEQMSECAVTLSPEGRILYGNRRLGEMVRGPPGKRDRLLSCVSSWTRGTGRRSSACWKRVAREHPWGSSPAGRGWDLDPRPGLADAAAVRLLLRCLRDPRRPLDPQRGRSGHAPGRHRPVVRRRDLQPIAGRHHPELESRRGEDVWLFGQGDTRSGHIHPDVAGCGR